MYLGIYFYFEMPDGRTVLYGDFCGGRLGSRYLHVRPCTSEEKGQSTTCKKTTPHSDGDRILT